MSEQVKKKIKRNFVLLLQYLGRNSSKYKKQANKKKAINSEKIKNKNPIQTIPGSVMNQNNVNADCLFNNRRHDYTGCTKRARAQVYVMALGM